MQPPDEIRFVLVGDGALSLFEDSFRGREK
jgi:hypothetical protein